MTDWMTINKGAKYTNDTDVLVQINVYGGQLMYLTTDPTCQSGSNWENFSAERSWILPKENQPSTVYGLFKRLTTRGAPVETECMEASIIHDGIAPVVKLSQTPDEFTQSGDGLFKFDVTDNISGVEKVECKMDNGSYAPCDLAVSQLNMAEGQHRFTIRSTDKAGNVSAPMEYPWMIDQTPPVVKLDSTPAASSMSKAATFKFTGTDAGSGIHGYFCQVTGEAEAPCSSPFVRADVGEGQKSFSVYAVDNVGLKSLVISYNWLVNSLPLGAFDVLGVTGTKDTKLDSFLAGDPSPKINWSASTNAVSYDVAILNSAKNATVCSVSGVTGLSYQFPSSCSLTDGATYYASVMAINAAGVNISSPLFAFKVDLLGPAIAITTPVTIPVDHKSALVKFSITDAISGVDTAVCYHTYGGVVSSYTCKGLTQLNLANLSPGQHSFSIKASDSAGNLSESSEVTFILESRELIKHMVDVDAAPTQIDVLMVIDNSGSMDEERKKLSEKLADFISRLNGLDWRVCLTTTSPKTDGQLKPFATDVYKIDKDTVDYNNLFLAAVKGNLGDTSGDEQGIKATVRAVETNDSRCFRNSAALAVVLISDEDERSWGGYPEYSTQGQYQVLGTKNLPATAVEAVRLKYGDKKIFTYHSIVIKYNDTTCKSSSAGQYGRRYEELSALTSGIVGSLCAANYGTELAQMADRTKKNLSSAVLKCAPVAGTLKLSITPSVAGQTYAVSGDKVSFTPNLIPGSQVSFEYYCVK